MGYRNFNGKLFSIIILIISLTSCLEDENSKQNLQNRKRITFETQLNSSDYETLAVSLKALQQELMDCQSYSKELLHLSGLNKLTGYIFDKENNDLILIGKTDESLPDLYLEDFVIALRNAWNKYTIIKDNIPYYSNPGCSIDPDTNILKRLDAISQPINSDTSINNIERLLDKWCQICMHDQKVRVLGIPYNSHFAKIMVKADYDMKAIADGSDSLEIENFHSLTNRRIKVARLKINNSKPDSNLSRNLNRFWLYPGKMLFERAENITIIKQCAVTLQTEEEHLHKGKIIPTGKIDKLAQQFAKDFTDNYIQISQQRSVYSELENLFRFVALAKLLKFSDVGFDLSYLLEDFEITQTHVNSQLPGKPHISRYENKQNNNSSHFWLRSCGGVDIDININQNQFKYNNDYLAELKKTVIENRPSSSSIFWRANPDDKIRELVKAKSDDNVRFFYLSTIPIRKKDEDDIVVIQFGTKKVKVSLAELDRLINGSPEVPCFDRLFPSHGRSKQKVIIYRGDFSERRYIDKYYKNRETPEIQSQLLLALRNRYPNYEFYLDDEMDLAKSNIENLPKIYTSEDIGAYIIKMCFEVKDYNVLNNIKDILEEAGIQVEESLVVIERPNILIISGHKDEQYKSYLTNLGNRGALNGKCVISFSCYDSGDETFNSNLIKKYGAKEIIFFPAEIHPSAVEDVIIGISTILQNNRVINLELIELLNRSIEQIRTNNSIKNDDLEKLKNGIPQISFKEEKILKPFLDLKCLC